MKEFNQASTPILLLVMLALTILGFYVDTTKKMYNAGRATRHLISEEDFDLQLLLTYPKEYLQTWLNDYRMKK